MTHRNQILKSHADAIGSSQIADLISEPPYGCVRKLAYEKLKIDPDYERIETPDMKRGLAMEDVITTLYLEENPTHIVITRQPEYYAPGMQKLVSHPDRIIRLGSKSSDPLAVMEIKCPGLAVFGKIRTTGAPMSWVLQCQAAMLCAQVDHARLVIFNTERWQLLTIPLIADQGLQGLILDKVKAFWIKAEHDVHWPDRLAPNDPRCRRCEYRHKCQGEALREVMQAQLAKDGPVEDADDADLDRLAVDYLAAKEVEREAQQVIEELKPQILDRLGERAGVKTRSARIYAKAFETRKVDTKMLKAAYPTIAEEVTRVSMLRPLRVLENS